MIDPSNLALVGLDSSAERFGQVMHLCRTLQQNLDQERLQMSVYQNLVANQEKLIEELQKSRETMLQKIRQYLEQAVLIWRKKVVEAQPDSEDHLVARCYVDAFQSVHTSLFGELVP